MKNKNAQKKKWPTKHQLGFILIAIGFLLYSNTLTHDYALDDYSVIKENYVTKQGLSAIPTIWTHHLRYGFWSSPGTLYRPFTQTVFAFQWHFFGDTPFIFHLFNILSFCLLLWFLFDFLQKLTKNITVSFLISLLFAVHPIHTEVVSNIKSLDEILSFLFVLITFNYLFKSIDKSSFFNLLATGFFFFIALASKEGSITFLILFPFTLWWIYGKKLKYKTWIFLPVVIVSGLFIYIRHHIIGSSFGLRNISVLDNYLVDANSYFIQFINASKILFIYFIKSFFPYELIHDAGFQEWQLTGIEDISNLGAVTLLSVLFFGSIYYTFKKNLAAFGILFFFISISLVSNIFLLIGTNYGERLLFVPSLGIMITFVFLLNYAQELNIDIKNKTFLFAISTSIVFAGMTFTRNPDWKSSYTIYKADITKAPNSVKLNYHLGLEYVKLAIDSKSGTEKDSWYNKSIDQFEKSVQLYPKYADGYGQIGLYYFRQKKYDKAIENYEKAIKYKANKAVFYSNLGIIYFEKKNIKKAKELYIKAVNLDPRFVDALRNLGVINALEQNFNKAIELFATALKYAPNDKTLTEYLNRAKLDLKNKQK